MKIRSISARTIPNSRKKPAIEITINKKYTASAPSGASTGSHEVQAFPKKGIKFSVESINTSKDLLGMQFEEFNDLEQLDKLIPTVGGNTVIALQFAVLKAISNNNIWKFLNPKAKSLPIPVGNVVGGGAHTKKISTDIQEYLLIPSSKSFYENAFINSYIHKKAKNIVRATTQTDEGAWIPRLSNLEVFEELDNMISDKDNTLGLKVHLGIDMAASELWNGRSYIYNKFSKQMPKRKLSRKTQIEYVQGIIRDYKLAYVEDPFHENDFVSFSKIQKNTLVCGDDLITTNIERLKTAIRHNSVNCVIIKPNQIGSIVKTYEVVNLAHRNNVKTIISHRSGETMDNTITHLAVAWGIPYLKCGIYGKERKAKLDEGVKIEKEIFG